MTGIKKNIPAEVLSFFFGEKTRSHHHSEEKLSIQPIGDGLINDSFHIAGNFNQDIFLQRINKHVFKAPAHIQENYIRVYEHIRSEQKKFSIPVPKKPDSNNEFLFKDHNGEFWRAFEFIHDAKTVATATNSSQAGEVARCFGKFTALMNGFDVSSLHKTIPGFHDLSLRYSQFNSAIESASEIKKTNAYQLIDQLKIKEKYVEHYREIIQSDHFPLRVIHHDAKISNILFNSAGSTVICPVDFDTVMPGYIFSDLGDMIRSMVSDSNEDENNNDLLTIRKDFYNSIVEGYMQEMGSLLTSEEEEQIHFSGLMMIYMQALRFITDYLSGNIYYRIKHPEHNLQRALNQLTLLKSLERFLEYNYQFRI